MDEKRKNKLWNVGSVALGRTNYTCECWFNSQNCWLCVKFRFL